MVRNRYKLTLTIGFRLFRRLWMRRRRRGEQSQVGGAGPKATPALELT